MRLLWVQGVAIYRPSVRVRLGVIGGPAHSLAPSCQGFLTHSLHGGTDNYQMTWNPVRERHGPDSEGSVSWGPFPGFAPSRDFGIEFFDPVGVPAVLGVFSVGGDPGRQGTFDIVAGGVMRRAFVLLHPADEFVPALPLQAFTVVAVAVRPARNLLLEDLCRFGFESSLAVEQPDPCQCPVQLGFFAARSACNRGQNTVGPMVGHDQLGCCYWPGGKRVGSCWHATTIQLFPHRKISAT